MRNELKHTLARGFAKQLIELFGENVENLSVYETVGEELEGLDQDLIDEIEQRVFNFLEVSDIHVSFAEWKLDPKTGERLSDEVLRERHGTIEPLDF